jgi:ribosomal protein S18 acetylase RimI-like enzyme
VKVVSLRNGTSVLLREFTLDDIDRSLAFFRALPVEDRRYLRVDVTRRDNVERRIRRSLAGEVRRIVGLVEDEIVADATLEFSREGWYRHSGEIRVIVGKKFRRQGLGVILIQEIFDIAKELGIEKVVVMVPAPQKAARLTCRRLGFREAAVLEDHVKDEEGNLHPLVVMTCNMNEIYQELQGFYREHAAPDG